MSDITTERYTEEARRGIADPVLRKALAFLQDRFGRGTAEAYLRLPEGPGLREDAHRIRERAIENLDVLLETLAGRIRERGGHVFFAATARDAVDYCLSVARRTGVRRVVKGKSMVTEEIGLNPALEAAGVEVVETDLGEYIIQLAGEKPSHIIAPAIHKTRHEVADLFVRKLGIRRTTDPPELTQAARAALREKFLTADMGTSGVNMACAETGHITTVSNEGNIRMATTMPRVHVAFMGMERIVGRLDEYEKVLRLICRGASAQTIGTYVSFMGGPRRPGQSDGPDEFHLVVLDNGRSRILADPRFREMLCCVRCAACLNVCPVYGKIGGHSYGFAYSGPVGAVVTPLLTGVNRAKDLCRGETLCGACKDACSMAIDLPRMLLLLREMLAYGDPVWGVTPAGRLEAMAYRGWSWLVRSRRVYEAALRLAAIGQRLLPRAGGMIRRLPPPFDGWTRNRDLTPLAPETFTARWRRTHTR
ncbi:MAG TPA: lactate utilization protein B [Desulfobacterales bacterium]|nr:lactate utilization protein B [Desulfobacterales bacterium]